MADPLNILHTIDLETLYPIVRCEITLAHQLDEHRLEMAVKLAGEVVPEIFAKYRIADNHFVSLVHDPKLIVMHANSVDENQVSNFDLLIGPQLRIMVVGNQLIIYLSHILTDGAGSKQFLYLLAACYNQLKVPDGLVNHQDIEEIKALIHQTPEPALTNVDHPSRPLFLPQLADHQPAAYEVIKISLEPAVFVQLHEDTQKLGFTLNDWFMAAFGKTIQQYCGVATIALACPTDMRQFLSLTASSQLRIQNLTARYNFEVTSDPAESVKQTAQKVHKQMQANKQNKQFLQSIRALVKGVDQGKSIEQLQATVESNYHVRPIAYTNFGVISTKRLKFVNNIVQSCVMTGSFRRFPMYQVAVSTFGGQLTLAANMIGSPAERQFGRAVLNHLKLALLATLDRS
ncbi:hypothetical protein YK48G_19910 [Lentilactobacillus fungorum]|uniref:Condensation domain-containing protein n=1 Tax=Lentilactobacillus fungorum TaxID=2201250 RepID=A0ABQ3W2B9_9LACO|nr:hypothetical protein [Lentilactobacillus fungorum]GHP14566.1 hypothetical protein YK48G_19910 [Lentilactobacillus fungorum]